MYPTKLVMIVLAVAVLAGGWLAASTAQAQESGQSYVVQRGDTLFRIAEKYLGDGHRYPDIVAATQAKHAADASFAAIQNPNIIEVGAKLWVPAAGAVQTPPVSASAASPPVQNGNPFGKIAFAFWNNAPDRCTYEINVIDVPACLTSSEACQANRRIFALNNASEPALSPDGQRLAFRGWGGIPEKYKEGTVDHPYYGCSTPHPERQVGHTTLDGTDYFRVTQYWEDSHPDWSPDGQRLLFDTNRLGDGITRLMAASADGSFEQVLRLAGQQPSWAPDSNRFVYRGCDLTGNRCGLWLARALPVEAWDLGLNLLAPVLVEPDAAHPDWSPVSDRIVYQSPVSGNWELYAINADGSGQQQLTNTAAIEGLPVWSPDGQWLAFLSDDGGNWGIWLMRPDGSERQQLFAFDGGEFSPLPVPPYGQRSWLDEQISWAN